MRKHIAHHAVTQKPEPVHVKITAQNRQSGIKVKIAIFVVAIVVVILTIALLK